MSFFKQIIRLPVQQVSARRRRARFNSICKQCELKLDFAPNSPGLPILEELFVKRIYADHFPFYRRNCVLDIGGHFGYFAIFAAVNSAPGSRIVTIEPSTHNLQVLQANVSRMGLGDTIQTLHGAVAEQTGTADVYISHAHNCSLISGHAEGFDAPQLSTETVPTFSLQDLIAKNNLDVIDVLKLDCEGAEYSIIKQTPSLILQRVRVIMMEFHDLKDANRSGLAMVDELQRKGFRIAQFHHLPTNMNLNFGKIIAVRD